jgi:carbon storage regulator
MLVLSRKVNERIQIGDEITITVVRVSPNSVRIGINAPPHMVIARDELNDSALSIGSAENATENRLAP